MVGVVTPEAGGRVHVEEVHLASVFALESRPEVLLFEHAGCMRYNLELWKELEKLDSSPRKEVRVAMPDDMRGECGLLPKPTADYRGEWRGLTFDCAIAIDCSRLLATHVSSPSIPVLADCW